MDSSAEDETEVDRGKEEEGQREESPEPETKSVSEEEYQQLSGFHEEAEQMEDDQELEPEKEKGSVENPLFEDDEELEPEEEEGLVENPFFEDDEDLEPEKEKGLVPELIDSGDEDEVDVEDKEARPVSGASNVSTMGLGSICISSDEEEDTAIPSLPIQIFNVNHQTNARDHNELFEERRQDLDFIASSKWSAYKNTNRSDYQNVLNIIATMYQCSEKGSVQSQRKYQTEVVPKYREHKKAKFNVQALNEDINKALKSHGQQKKMNQFFKASPQIPPIPRRRAGAVSSSSAGL